MDTTLPPQISCVSLGMLIMDEIRTPSKPPLVNVIGGSSTFVTLGLRLFTSDPSTVGCLILAGSDFPPAVEAEVRSWGTTLVLNKSPDKQSSRGLLVYEDDTFGPKTFKYTTSPLRASPHDLVATPLLRALAFHFFGPPEEICHQVPQLLRLRQTHAPALPKPFIIWEPLPSSCVPANRTTFLDACTLVNVFSPNHLELQALFSDTAPPLCPPTLAHLERLGSWFLTSGTTSNGPGAVVIRAGEHGALALRRDEQAVRVPAYHAHGDQKVVDPTGAGNAFLGGYVAGWMGWGREIGGSADEIGERMREAMCCGAVAASFAIEQIGLPASEAVNARAGMARLAEYKARLEREDRAGK